MKHDGLKITYVDIDDILHDGGLRARARISETVNEAKRRMGVPGY